MRGYSTSARARLVGVACVVAFLFGLAAIASASVPDADGRIYGCANNATGVARIIDKAKPGTLGACIKSGVLKETPVSWNASGAAGPAGPPGPAGATGPVGPSGTTGFVSVEEITWSTVIPAGDPLANSASVTTIEAGSTLHALRATVTADFSACDWAWSVRFYAGDPAGPNALFLGEVSEVVSGGEAVDHETFDIFRGVVTAINADTPLYAEAFCDRGDFFIIPTPDVRVDLHARWEHPPPHRTIG